MSWFYLALIAPFLYAIVNLIDDNLMRFIYKGPYLATTVTSLFGALPLVSLLFLKTTPIPVSYAMFAMIAGFLTSIYYFFYFKALEVEQPAVVIALFGLVPATLPILAHFILGEALGGKQIVGLSIVVLASFLLAVNEVRNFKVSKALLSMIIAVALLDIVSLLVKHTYEHVPFYPAFMYLSLGLGLGGLYFPMVMFYSKTKHDLSMLQNKLGKMIWLFMLVEGLVLLAAFIQNLAISRGSVSLIRVIEGVQPVYVLLIALVFYRFSPKHFREILEGGLIKKFSLMALIVAGLVLVHAG